MAVFTHDPLHIMAGRHAVGAEIVRDFQQVAELDGLVAAYARDRRFAAQVAVGKIVDDGFPEVAFVIQNIVRESAFLGDAAGVINILSGASGAFFGQRRAVIVEL